MLERNQYKDNADKLKELQDLDIQNNMETIVKEKRKEIFDIFSNNIVMATENDDISTIDDLKDKLDKKKVFLEDQLSATDELTKENITTLRTTISTSGEKTISDIKPTPADVLTEFNQIGWLKNKKTSTAAGNLLFKKTSTGGNDKDEKKLLQDLGESANESKFKENLDKILTQATKTGKDNIYSISTSKFKEKEYKERVRRIGAFLQIFSHLPTTKTKLSEDALKKINKTIKYIQEKEIPLLHELHNTNTTLKKVDEIKNKLDIAKTIDTAPTQKEEELQQTSTTTIQTDIKSEFTKDKLIVEKYVIHTDDLDDWQRNKITIKNTSGAIESRIASKEKDSSETIKDIFITISWVEKKLGTLVLNNIDPSTWFLKLEIRSQQDLIADGITNPEDIEFDLPIIAKYKWAHTTHTGLTKHLKIKLKTGIDPTIPDPDPIEVDIPEIELDAVFSNMKSHKLFKGRLTNKWAMNQIASKMAYDEIAQEFMKARAKGFRAGIGKNVKHAFIGEIRYLLKKRRNLKKLTEAKWDNISFKWKYADLAHIHGQNDNAEEFTSIEKNGDYPEVHAQISKTARTYYAGDSTMTDQDFGNKIQVILDPESNFSSSQSEKYQDEIKSLAKELKTNGVKLSNTASNIVDICRQQKTQNKLKYEITKAINNNNNKNAIQTALSTYYQNNQTTPQIFTTYNHLINTQTDFSKEDKIKATDTMDQLKEKFIKANNHQKVLMWILWDSNKEVSLKLRFLTKWDSAEKITHKNENGKERFNLGKLAFAARANIPGRFLWKAVTVMWLWLTGIGWLPITMWLAGIFAATHAIHKITKKIKSKEQDMATNYSRFQAISEKEPRLAHLSKYLESTGNYNKIIGRTESLLKQPSLSTEDQTELKNLAWTIMAWLDYQTKTGHLAFAVTGEEYPTAIKKLYLAKDSIINRIKSLDPSINNEEDLQDISQSNYISNMNTYTKNRKKFIKAYRKHRAIRGAIAWWVAAVAAWATARASNALFGWWSPDITAEEHPNLWARNDTSQAAIDLKSEISSQMSKLQPWDHIKYDFRSWVDGTPASTWTFSQAKIDTLLADIKTIKTTMTNLHNIKQIEDILKNYNTLIKANATWVSPGNANLYTLRALESTKIFLKQMKTSWHINNVKFDLNFDTTRDIPWTTIHNAAERIIGWEISPIKLVPRETVSTPAYVEPTIHKWNENRKKRRRKRNKKK